MDVTPQCLRLGERQMYVCACVCVQGCEILLRRIAGKESTGAAGGSVRAG